MRLKELFEAKLSVGIIFGRFNPPHKGHRAAWEMASKNPQWFVGTNQSTVGPKDPLPYDVKIEAMKAIWPELEGHIVCVDLNGKTLKTIAITNSEQALDFSELANGNYMLKIMTEVGVRQFRIVIQK